MFFGDIYGLFPQAYLKTSLPLFRELEVRARKQLLIRFLWAGSIIFLPVISGSVEAQNIFYSIDL